MRRRWVMLRASIHVRRIFGNDVLDLLLNWVRTHRIKKWLKLIDGLGARRGGVSARHKAHDARMLGGQMLFVVMSEFLVELLTGLQACELDLDVITDREAAKFDHLPGKIDDFHRL